MSIKIEMLRCFAMVAQTGTLAEAAHRLGRTQPAVSMTLKQFEETLGQPLFESQRKNRLTALGLQVFELAQDQVRQFDQTVAAIRTCASSPDGLVRIASIPSVAAQVFPAAIQTMIARHPGMTIDLRDTDTGQVVEALVRGQADIGIVSGAPVLNGVRKAHLFSDPYGLLCARQHPLARQAAPPSLHEVISDRFVSNNLLGQISSATFQDAIRGIKATVHNTMSLTAMVRSGEWVTILPQSVVRFLSPDLVFRPIANLPDMREVSLLMRENAAFPQLAQEFWDFLLDFDWTAESGPH